MSLQMKFLPALATVLCCAALAVPAQAQVGISVGVGGGPSVGVEVGSGAPSVSVSVGGNGGGDIGGEAATATPSTEILSQDDALAAVENRRAVPLEQIMAEAARLTDGQIIDAQLITLRGFLLYELKVLETTGDVVELYFYARSGQVVRTD